MIPNEIREHLRGLVKNTDLPDNDDTFELLLSAWVRKEKLFSSQTSVLGMEQVQSLDAGDSRGMLLLTNSGSLISLFPAGPGESEGSGPRRFEYASISLRLDVPDILKGSKARVTGEVRTGRPVELEDAPVKKSSSIYRIAVYPAGTSLDVQETRIREATIFLTNGFVRINKQITSPGAAPVDHFTKQSIVAYIAKRNELNQKEVRQVLDDYVSMLESAMLLGEKVNFGHLGKLSLKVRPAQKARIGRNPATGEELTIPAKPPQYVPKISFSSYIKDRAAEVEVEPEE
jgi:nucleoid DNA-binding protein